MLNIKLQKPFKGDYPISQGFGKYSQDVINQLGLIGDAQNHYGIDYALPVGTPVLAAHNGTVLAINLNPNTNEGLYIILLYDGVTNTQYYHLSAILVKQGQQITAGQEMGLSGATGYKITGPHLHFQLNYNNERIDPTPYFISSINTDMNYFRDIDDADISALEAYYRKTRTDVPAILQTFGSIKNHWHDAGWEEVNKFLVKYEDEGVIHAVGKGDTTLGHWLINFSPASYPNRSLWGTDKSLSIETETRIRAECQNQTQGLQDQVTKLTQQLEVGQPAGDYAALQAKVDKIKAIVE